jgi:hypothetical protein
MIRHRRTLSLLAGALLASAASAAGCGSQEAAGEPLDPPGRAEVATPLARWAFALAGPGGEQVAALAVGPDGTVFVAGQFEEELEIGSDLLLSAGGADAFVAAFSGDGEPLWAERIGGRGFDAASALAILPDGGVAVAGVFSDALEGARARGETDLFAAAFTGGGSRAWLSTAGGPGWVSVSSASAAPDGSLWISGTRGRFEGGAARPLTGPGDALVVRVGPGGAVELERGFGGPGWDQALGVAATADGGAVVVGSFTGELRLADRRLVSAGGADGFIVGLTAAGEPRWAHRLGGAGQDAAAAVAVGPGGQIAVAARFEGTAQLAGVTLRSAGLADNLVLLLGASGEIRRAVRHGAAGRDAPRSIAFAPGGGLLLAATGSVFPELGASSGPTEAVVTRLDDGGDARGSFRVRGVHVTASAAADPRGAVVVAGSFVRSASVGGVTLRGRGGLDGFVASVTD